MGDLDNKGKDLLGRDLSTLKDIRVPLQIKPRGMKPKMDLIKGRIRIRFERPLSSRNTTGIDNVAIHHQEQPRTIWLEIFDSYTTEYLKTGIVISNHTYYIPPHRIVSIELELDA